jgi:signal transduction histidine kinase
MHTLRSRLLLSYAALALMSVVLASSASLYLFGRSLDDVTNREMAATAGRMANALEAESEDGPIADLNQVLFSFFRRGPRGSMWVSTDNTGKPLPTRFGTGYHTGFYPPAPAPGPNDMPAVRQARLPSGQGVFYSTVAVPERALPEDGPRPAFLVLVRPEREVSGQWRVLLWPIALVGAMAVAISSLAALALARTITRPLEDLTTATDRVAQGDYAVRVEVPGKDEVSRLAVAFNAMSRQVGEAQRRQRDFVANVSHDLRTPLTTVRGFTGALLDGTAGSEEQRRHAAEAIDVAAARMDTLVTTLVDLARLEGGKVTLDLRPTPLAMVIEQVVAMAEPAAARQEVTFAVTVSGAPVVTADGQWLTRALGNVVDNAVRFAPRGGTVRIAAAEGPDGFVTLSVTDDGPGIASEDLPRVFDRFYRGDKSRLAGNSGLGLAIAREIVLEHGGDINIASVPSLGTQVNIELPRA